MDVYAWILQRKDKLNFGRSAEGLHHAVRGLRDRTHRGHYKKSDPLVWASFIHVGI